MYLNNKNKPSYKINLYFKKMTFYISLYVHLLYIPGLPANVEIRETREKSGNEILSKIGKFQVLTKSQKNREKSVKTVFGYDNFQ